MAVTEGKTLLQKADLALADILTGGRLAPEQFDRYVQLNIKEGTLLKDVTVVGMDNDRQEISKMRFSGQVLQPGTEASALPVGLRSKPSLANVTLTAQLLRAEVRMSQEVAEDQIERGTFAQSVMGAFVKAINRDLEKLLIQGDTLSADVLLAVLDGLIKQATSNVVAGGSVTLSKEILRDMWKLMPDEFATPGNVFYTNRQAVVAYKDSISNKATGLGDMQTVAGWPAGEFMWSDLKGKANPLFPNNLGGSTNETVVLLTDPKENIHVGFHRKVKLQTVEVPQEGVLLIVGSMRVDVKYVEETAVVKATAIKGV